MQKKEKEVLEKIKSSLTLKDKIIYILLKKYTLKIYRLGLQDYFKLEHYHLQRKEVKQ